MTERDMPLIVDRAHYTQLMAQKLPVLRASLGITQTELAEMIGVTRQTLSAAESGVRPLSWGNFVSLLFIFTQNEQTHRLLETLEIYTEELNSMFCVTNLSVLEKQSNLKSGKIKDKK